jgi:CHAT domain-containing protein/tetratricopeptide (TPR) repeat protein
VGAAGRICGGASERLVARCDPISSMARPRALVASLCIIWPASSVALAVGAQDSTPGASAAVAKPISLSIDAPGAAGVIGDDAGSEPNVRIYKAAHRGRVNIWASAQELDPVLRVADESGASIVEDDNSGGGTTAFVSIEVKPERVLRIRVDGAKPASSGVARLSIRELPETEETESAADAARALLAEIEKQSTEAKPEATRARLTKLVDDLLATPGADRSDALHQALWAVSKVVEAQLDDADAERIHRVQVEFLEATCPKEMLRVQRERVYWAAMLLQVGKAPRALEICLDATSVLERTRPRGDVEIYVARGVTADAYGWMQQLERARDIYRDVLEGFDRILPESDIRRTDVRQNLGLVLSELGELDEARELQEQVLEAYKRMLPEDDPYRIAAENNLATTLHDLGDKQAALALHRHVLESRLRTLPADHFEVAAARLNVAVGLFGLGDLAAAQELLEQSLQGYSARFPESHPFVEQARLDLACVLDERGETASALSLLEKTISLHDEPLDKAPLPLWRTEAELMVARDGAGDLRGALAAGEAAVAIMSRLYSSESPDILDQECRIATLLAKLDRAEEARARLFETAQKMQRFLAECASSMPARQAEAVEASWSRLVSSMLSLLAEPGLGAGQRRNLESAFALIESSRGIGTNVLRCSRALETSAGRDAVDAKRSAVREASAHLARLADDADARTELEDAVRSKERAEREMRSAIAAALGGRIASPNVEASSVSAALRDGEVAIGYWIYARRTAATKLRSAGEPSLLAIVVRRDGTLARVELGPLVAIEAAAASWRRAIANVAGGKSDASVREKGEALRKLVVDPLRESAGSARRWIVALDGALHLVPLDALPDGDGCLGDRVAIDLRPVLWDLRGDRAKRSGETVLVGLGGVDYDAELEASPDANGSENGPGERVPAARAGAAPRFDALPETAQEVGSIAELFRGAHPRDARTELLENAAASKEALLARAPSATFLHLATHGFFAPAKSVLTREDMLFDSSASAGDAFSFEREVRGFAPMTLCGLALSGANKGRTFGSAAPGVITAEELGTLDLARCELGVLSACDTNVGERIAGQGIASFQKALHAAGVRTVVTSLWRVPDQATHELMVAFYRNLWIEKLPKAESLWKAKEALRAERAPLRDWAAWVLSGDPE